MKKEIKIGNHLIGDDHPVYFIADIAANHDGNLDRAKQLIKLAKESGADAVKFQHHDVSKYVSETSVKEIKKLAWYRIFQVINDCLNINNRNRIYSSKWFVK